MKDSLGDRMKGYEDVSKTTFIRRMPVIIRLDGKGFSRYTRPLKDKSRKEPFDDDLHCVMRETMAFLCHEIQNVVFAYVQSDEISILLKDWTEHETQQWFGGKQSKIESVSASIATGFFNHYKTTHPAILQEIKQPFATFDSRAFNIPKEDVTNYFIWRQKDCIRNSVSMLAQHHFSHKSLQGLSTEKLIHKMDTEIGVNWRDDVEPWAKFGTCWTPDIGLSVPFPIFTENREFIENQLV